MTDHDRRVAALSYAHELLLRVGELFDLPRALDHAQFIGDVLHDHRASNPEATARAAREWADRTMEGWRDFEVGWGTVGSSDPPSSRTGPLDAPDGGDRAGSPTDRGGGSLSPPAAAPLLPLLDVDGFGWDDQLKLRGMVERGELWNEA